MVKRFSWPLARFVINGLLLAVLILAIFNTVATAQEVDSAEGGRLFITSSDASSAPIVVLRAYGINSQGLPVNLAEESTIIIHGEHLVEAKEVVGDYNAGTFVLFVVDLPPGISPHLPAIQEAIQGYASAPNMEERIDHMAIYQVAESEATELLAPTNFYNAVRNFFSVPLTTQSGPTALVDSVGNLLTNIDSIKPKDDQYTSIVVFTDGTDPVSAQYNAEEIGSLASDLGVPIHTVWLENDDLQDFSHTAGREYLAGLSAQSRGVAARLDQPAEVQSIFDRISSFSNQQVIQYTIPRLAGGEYDVQMLLDGQPQSQGRTTVVIPTAAPSVTMNLPAESLEIILKDLDSPISLSLSAAVSWLDGIDREITSAELLVNGIPVQEIEITELEKFPAEIDILNYGANSVQVAITDEQGFKATSPESILMISQGKTQVPEEIQAENFMDSLLGPLFSGCLTILLILLFIAALIIIVRRIGLWDKITRSGRSATPARVSQAGTKAKYTPSSSDSRENGVDQSGYTPAQGVAYLEILHSVTRMAPAVELTDVEHRIGRSPVQADIVFENDITVSRLHASIVKEGSDYRIYDEGSTSGTYVNGQPVPDYGYQLLDGDEVILGDALIRYRRS